jgi:deoxyribonuclease IV
MAIFPTQLPTLSAHPLPAHPSFCYRDRMAILGAHQSIAGGYHRAVEQARQCGCDCVQLFTKNNNQWSAKDITLDEARRFRDTLAQLGVIHPIAHDSYLINLASPNARLWRKSVDAFVDELCRADSLAIPYVVTHPGAYTAGSEQSGLQNVIRAVDEIHAQSRGLSARCLLETTAGQGTSLGWQFEQLARILDGVADPDRLGICFDTCHVFAAGYAFGTPKEYKATMAAFDRLIGLDRIKAFHLNDSRRPRGSRVDRHEHIGRGELGLAPFRLLLADRRFRNVPMYLETPKGVEKGVDCDVINLQVLRGFQPSKP